MCSPQQPASKLFLRVLEVDLLVTLRVGDHFYGEALLLELVWKPPGPGRVGSTGLAVWLASWLSKLGFVGWVGWVNGQLGIWLAG